MPATAPRRARRPAARILLLDPADRLLLFRFTPDDRPPFWVTPGGAVDPGESFEAAARRELFEETGLSCAISDCVGVRHVSFVTLEGVEVDAEERYFVARPGHNDIVTAAHTELERRVMLSHRWWTPAELATLEEEWFPIDLIELWAEVVAAG